MSKRKVLVALAEVTCFIVAIAICSAARAQITLDGTLGPAGALVGPDYRITPESGLQAGGNLFHSFGVFNIRNGESATFAGPISVTTVIGRVTGGEASRIDGTLRSEIAGADLFLLNPTGVLFGPDARLEIDGSFYASTADYLRLGEDGRFVATDPADSVLSTAPVSAFGFLGGTPGTIDISGSLLAAPTGATLGLVSGDLTIDQANLYAPDGRIDLAAAASAGEFVLTASGLTLSGFSALGSITATRPAFADLPVIDGQTIADLDVSGEAGGGVDIHAARVLFDGAQLYADTLGTGVGRGIEVKVTDELVLRGGARLTTDNLGSGEAGAIDIQAGGAIRLADLGTAIASRALAAGDGGEIRIEAPLLELNDAGIQVGTTRAGRGGTLQILTERLRLRDGAAIQTDASGDGRGGSIVINASEFIDIADRNPEQRASGVFGNTFGAGRGGDLVLSAPLIVLTNSGVVAAQSLATAEGGGGTIRIDADRLILAGGSRIESGTFSAAPGGDIVIDTTDVLVVEGANARGEASGIAAGTLGAGQGGTIEVTTRELIVAAGATVSVASRGGFGDAGSIVVTAKTVRLAGGSVSSESQRAGGGQIDIGAGDLVYLLDGRIETSVAGGADNAGNIRIARPEAVVLDGGVIRANAIAGRGGNIGITTEVFFASPDSVVEASSQLGIDGTVRIESVDADLKGSLAVLSKDFLDVSAVLGNRCGARLAEDISSFTVRDRGLGASPDDPLPAPGLFATDEIGGTDERLGHDWRPVDSNTGLVWIGGCR